MKKILLALSLFSVSLISLGFAYSSSTGMVGTGEIGTGTLGSGTTLLMSTTGGSSGVHSLKSRTLFSPISIRKKYNPLPYGEDTSIFRFVSRDRPLNMRGYEPNDLLSISGAHIDTAGRSGLRLREEARDSLWVMAGDFEQAFGVPLTVISTYRSAAYQQRMWDLGKCTDSLCAPPGYSEHQLGLAMDIFDATTEDEYFRNKNYRKYIEWFKQNAERYGWSQSYQKGEDIDKYQVEPWHWRYLGVDMATKLKNLGWTYTEYVGFQEILSRR